MGLHLQHEIELAAELMHLDDILGLAAKGVR